MPLYLIVDSYKSSQIRGVQRKAGKHMEFFNLELGNEVATLCMGKSGVRAFKKAQRQNERYEKRIQKLEEKVKNNTKAVYF